MDTDYTAWLGPAAADLTDEQRDAFETAASAYYALPLHFKRDPEDVSPNGEEDDTALTAILQGILGEDTLTAVAYRARTARLELDGWVRAMAARGATEVEIARMSGLARPTIRKRLGK